MNKIQKMAADRAAFIVSQCKMEQHAYLDRTGFSDVKGLVWHFEEGKNLLIVPMRVGRDLVGVQYITREGEKSNIYGQITERAEYVIDNKGVDIWCTEYATALSIHVCLKALKMRYRIHCCFDLENLQRMAKNGVVVADNDRRGRWSEALAGIGLPFWQARLLPSAPPVTFNEFHKRVGTLKAGFELAEMVRRGR